MKKNTFKVYLFLLAGILTGFPLFSLLYYTLVRTSTPEFCSVCHEIQPAFNTWKTSTHVNNERGFVADCMDCHLPAPQDTYEFFYAKTMHGLKDAVAHFFLEEYDRERNRQSAYRSIQNDQCQKCHRNLLYMPCRRGAMLAHRSVLYPLPGYEKQCTDCHRNLVHHFKESFDYGRQ